MAPTSGRNGPALSEQLFDRADRFDFFQAVRLLRRMAMESSGRDPAARGCPVGYDFVPKQEVVRLRSLASHAFAPGAIHDIQPPRPAATQGESAAAEMVTTFFGLTGPQGVLPQHYTTLLIERIRAKDFSLRDFLDMFHHRLLSLFYRAWEKYRFPFAYEEHAAVATAGEEDLFTRCLYSVIGMGTQGLRNRLEFDDEALLFYAGHFAHWPRSAVALEGVLNDYFEPPIAVCQFQGQWLYLGQDDQSALPSPRWPQGLHAQLGADVVVGERVWDVESKFRVRIGPIGYARFRRLMPCGDTLRPLGQMARLYVGPHLEFDVQLVLKAEEVPWCRLGGDGADPARLGWNTWVRSGAFQNNVSDAVFSPEV